MFRLLLILLAGLSTSSAWSADQLNHRTFITAADSKLVPPEKYSEASAFAAQGGVPIDIAMKIAGTFQGLSQHVTQLNDSSESPSACHLTVLRDGLLDDALRSLRYDIYLERTKDKVWSIKEVRLSWRCYRGDNDSFISRPCP